MKFLILLKIKREIPLKMWVKLLPEQFKYFDKLDKGKKIKLKILENERLRGSLGENDLYK